MAELKTKKNTASVEKFLNNVPDQQRAEETRQAQDWKIMPVHQEARGCRCDYSKAIDQAIDCGPYETQEIAEGDPS
jgi:hypothetical protein